MSRENNSRSGSSRRKYTQKERAKQQEATRLKITEAIVDLHRTVGPANTTVSDVAQRAGVGRMTVYKHFPTDVSLFSACSTHWSEQHPLPDFTDDLAIDDLEARCRSVLTKLYKYFADGHEMLGKIMRDAPSMPALQEVLGENWQPGMTALEDALMPKGLPAAKRKRVRAAIRLALDLTNWETMTGTGLSDAQAAHLAAQMVAASASTG